MSDIDRRDFLKLIGAGTAGAGAGFLVRESADHPREQYIPYVATPEDYTPGIASYYRTVCTQCPAGCGIEVRVREGRAKKIEGNPLHPVSQGHTCALGQSGLNDLYNPDRLRQPQQRRGDRGSGAVAPISWEQAYTTLAERLAALRRSGKAEGVALLTGAVGGHLDALLETFLAGVGSSRYLQYDFARPQVLYDAHRASYGRDEPPYFDLRASDFVLSFGADFLGTWQSPVHYGVGYGHLRQGGARRGTVIQIEPRMSLSGANADRWLPARPGSEGLIALALANRIGGGADYAAFTIERAAAASELPAEVIAGLADAFAAAERPLALAGGAAAHVANGMANVAAINALNTVGGAPVAANPDPVIGAGSRARRASYDDMKQLIAEMREGAISALIVHDTNPVFSLPPALGLREAIDAVPFVYAISPYVDETSAMADLILPPHASLESWFDATPDPGIGLAAASIAQPVVKPIHDTRAAGDIFIELGRRIDGDLAEQLPWDDTRAYLQARWRELFDARAGSFGDKTFERFWSDVLSAGVWAEEQRGPELPRPATVIDPGTPAAPGGEYPFHFVPFLSQAFHDGRGAKLPWQQELPDPLTGVVYSSWIELNPETAKRLGVRDGDVVEVASAAGTLRAPAISFPAIRPDVIAMPIGQGHATYGRYASGRGANPLAIVADIADRDSGAHAWCATPVKIERTGERVRLTRLSGTPRDLGRSILGPEGEGGRPRHHDDADEHHG